jgi:hypothetical protein
MQVGDVHKNECRYTSKTLLIADNFKGGNLDPHVEHQEPSRY